MENVLRSSGMKRTKNAPLFSCTGGATMLSLPPSFSCPNEWYNIHEIRAFWPLSKRLWSMIKFFHFRLGGRRREVLDDIDKWYILRERVLYIVFKKRCKRKKKNPFTLERKHHISKTIATFRRTAPILGVSKVLLSMKGSFPISSIKYQIPNTKDQRPWADIKYQISKASNNIKRVFLWILGQEGRGLECKKSNAV